MVDIEPFKFERCTAFKERTDLAIKLNEIIEKINDGDIIPDSFKERINQIERDIADINVSIADIDTEISELSDSVDTSIETVNQRIDDEIASIDDALSLKADITQLSDGSVTKIGTVTLGNNTQPIYLVDGVPTKVSDAFAVRGKDNTFSEDNTFNKSIETKNGIKAPIIGRQANNTPASGDIEPYNGWREMFSYTQGQYDNGCLLCIFNQEEFKILFVGAIYNFESMKIIKTVAGNLDIAYRNDTSKKWVFYARSANHVYNGTNNAPHPVILPINCWQSTGTINITQSSNRNYLNNVVYNNMDIPNIANYDSYTWYKL